MLAPASPVPVRLALHCGRMRCGSTPDGGTAPISRHRTAALFLRYEDVRGMTEGKGANFLSTSVSCVATATAMMKHAIQCLLSAQLHSSIGLRIAPVGGVELKGRVSIVYTPGNTPSILRHPRTNNTSQTGSRWVNSPSLAQKGAPHLISRTGLGPTARGRLLPDASHICVFLEIA